MYCTSHTAKIQSQIEETVVSHSAETPSPNSIEHSTSSYTNRSSKRKKSVSKETNYKSLNTFLTILMLIFTFAFQLHILLRMFGVMYKWFGNIKYCGFFSNLASIFWHSAKCVIYNILILRMKMAFDGSVYAYSNKIIYSFVIFVNIFWMYAIFGDSTEIYGTWEYIPSENAFWCQVHMAVFGVVISGGLDTILSMICLILFVKPLINVLRNLSQKDLTLENFVTKCFILTFLAIGSTAIWIILALFFELGAIAAIDVNINAVCILLMNSSYEKYYNVFCKLCHESVKKCKKKAPIEQSDIII